MSVVTKVIVRPMPLTAVVSGSQPPNQSVVLDGPVVTRSPVVCTREHDGPKLSHTETVNLPAAFVADVHGLSVLIVG